MSNLDMSEAIGMLAQEKGLTEEALLQVMVDALAAAYKRRPDAADEVVVGVNAETMEFNFTAYDVDEDGNWVNERDDTPERDELGRIAAQTFRQVMSQRIREVESERKFEEYANREGDIVTGIIHRTDARYTLLDLGRVEALLPQAEQVPFERPAQGDRQKAYIVEVRRTPKGPQIVVSRTHPGLIKRLFELEVPEIADGIVEIKACAREPGHRTKIAVWSNDHNVDPVGACVGARGARVRMVVNEMRGEKIDIVPFSDDVPDFVAKALSPAKVTQVILSSDRTQADVIVPDHQLSLAIGREGQNARLAARLTGVRVDIRSETQLAEGVPSAATQAEVEAGHDYAEGEWVANRETGEMEWHEADGSVISESDWQAQQASNSAAAAAAVTTEAETVTTTEVATAEAAEDSGSSDADEADADTAGAGADAEDADEAASDVTDSAAGDETDAATVESTTDGDDSTSEDADASDSGTGADAE
ncbi:MAG: transcription termination factor NusA [Acidimicrobiia bacterium]|nr:transcription termination factor NusA [Acidimicrobiia bacterium]